MTIKIIGAILVIGGCGSFGFILAAAHKRQVRFLSALLSAIAFMECEIQYKLTPLPDLCRLTADVCSGILKKLFLSFAKELDSQISPDVAKCMHAAIAQHPEIPETTKSVLRLLSTAIGQFNLEGQLKGLAAVEAQCKNDLQKLTNNQDVRIRNYQTLGLCAGAAVVILFI